ncbi:MAG: toll/interleukin-1 receptor domain-containing protein [Gemmatimonadetes bacterium]|nr:toll/interleukin-1 receptor domain-containing protein [Gemmatimonadota bacterium]
MLREHHPLHDAVSALAATGTRGRDLYRPIHSIIQQLLADQPEPLPALRELASIRHFDLFATTTPDGLLARALDTVRREGTPPTDQIVYAPLLPTERRRDIPEVRSSKYRAVFYMFGKVDVSPFYAIHDEDVLEAAYTLQYLENGVAPFCMFSELRSRNLLLIGCNFAEWLSRFFLRLSNQERLSSDQRLKKEFLVDSALAEDGNLTVFLERFSRDSRCYPMAAREFVAELYRRWNERNPPASGALQDSSPATDPADSSGSGSIFISYAREDIGAARRLFEEVQEIGGDVVWFDKSELKPGDDWKKEILSAVKRCRLFLPLLSANTEERTDGFFRREWNLAADRSVEIEGRKFILPTVIDPEFSGASGQYERVPEEFKAFQYNHAPGGHMSKDLKDALGLQLRHLHRRLGRVA